MSKPDKTTLLTTGVLLLAILIILPLSGCKTNPGNSENTEQEVHSTQPDSSNLVSLDLLIRSNPTDASLFARRARLQADRQNYRDAMNDISIALSLDSVNPTFYIDQAEYFIYNGQPNDAKNSLAVCQRLHPRNTDAKLKLAEIHLYLKEYPKAQLVLREVNAINSNLPQVYFLQGLIALENEDSTIAVRHMQTAISKDPDYYAAYMQAGKILSEQEDPLGEQYLISAIELLPESYEARYQLGLLYQDQGKVDLAEEQYDYIIREIDSTLAVPYYNKGYLQLIHSGDFEKAISYFSKAIEFEPGYAEAWYNRGLCHELIGRFREARQDYQKVLELQTNYPLAIKGLNRLDEGKPIKVQ